jgi:PLP dependent protein
VLTTLEHNLDLVRRRIAGAAARAGRNPAEVTLLAVTKNRASEEAAELARLGASDLGESRSDELARKAAWSHEAGLSVRWHFVGHLQRNKARAVVECAQVIHSVDSLRLLATLERIADDVGRVPDVYLQVKLHPEETKTGFDPADVRAALERARASRSLRPVGLMTMAPLVDDPLLSALLARQVFRALSRLAREVEGDEKLGLSMGMSDDYEIAIEEGSTCVRVGSALFRGEDGAA